MEQTYQRVKREYFIRVGRQKCLEMAKKLGGKCVGRHKGRESFFSGGKSVERDQCSALYNAKVQGAFKSVMRQNCRNEKKVKVLEGKQY